jgi:hypothetical protein
MGHLICQYRTQWWVHTENEKWGFPCRAGEAISVIDYNGEARVCELREVSVNLGEFDYDFKMAMDSTIMLSEREIAKSHHCDCTHVCFLTTSSRQDPKTHLWSIPWLYLRYKLFGTWK